MEVTELEAAANGIGQCATRSSASLDRWTLPFFVSSVATARQPIHRIRHCKIRLQLRVASLHLSVAILPFVVTRPLRPRHVQHTPPKLHDIRLADTSLRQ